MAYKVEFTHQAQKALEWITKHERKIAQRIALIIDDLAEDPFQGKTLKGEFEGRYSYRVSDYRVIYTVHRRELLIFIIDIGHRREVYRK